MYRSPYRRSLYRRSPYRRSPYRRSLYRRSPYRRSLYRRSPYRRSPYRRSPYRRSLYRRSPYRRSPYRSPYRRNLFGGATHGMTDIDLYKMPSGIIYCIVNGQNYYIGNGIYRPASNPNSKYYANMFLPFYDIIGEIDKLEKYPYPCPENDNPECHFSIEEKIGNTPYYKIFDNNNTTILKLILDTIKQDCILEFETWKKKGFYELTLEDWEELNSKFKYITYDLDRKKYRFKHGPEDIIWQEVSEDEYSLGSILVKINEILPDSAELLIKYIDFILKKMVTINKHERIEEEDGKYQFSDPLLREGSNIPNLYFSDYKSIEGFNGKQWGMGGFESGQWSYLMILLQRFLIKNDLEQLKTSIDLTKSYMLQYKDNKESYNPKLHWYDYVKDGENTYNFIILTTNKKSL